MLDSALEGERVRPIGWAMTDARAGRPLLRPLDPGRRAWFALSLSLICPGWGHLYAGADARALAALLLAVLLVPALVGVWATLVGSTATALAWGAWTVAEVAAVPLESARIARRPLPPRARAGRRVFLHVLWAPIVLGFLVTELRWVYDHLARPFEVPSESMVPALLPGDRFFADVRPAARAELAPGDVIVFKAPDGSGVDYAKRIVAEAGQRVEVRGGRLLVDGRAATLAARAGAGAGRRVESLGAHRYAVEVGAPGELEDFGPVRVPPRHFFVMGDSRHRSADSRAFGPVPESAVVGRVARVFWSWDAERQRPRWERLGRVFPAAAR
jgi:signal peptidase I